MAFRPFVIVISSIVRFLPPSFVEASENSLVLTFIAASRTAGPTKPVVMLPTSAIVNGETEVSP